MCGYTGVIEKASIVAKIYEMKEMNKEIGLDDRGELLIEMLKELLKE